MSDPPKNSSLLEGLVYDIDDVTILIDLYANLPESRAYIAPLLRRHRSEVLAVVGELEGIDPLQRLLVMDAIGWNTSHVVDTIRDLAHGDRLRVIAHLRSRDVIAGLPWKEWLASDATLAPILGELVMRERVHALLPLVRQQLRAEPIPALISCVGSLRDRESLPLLVAALSRSDPELRPEIFESIAAIGDDDARLVLYSYAEGVDPSNVRLAARALARHASVEDGAIFRKLATHPDWAVRYQAAEALGELPGPENRRVLAVLAADESATVARRASRWLNAQGNVA